MAACRLDRIITNIFRYSLLLGLTTHMYDTSSHRLVHSSGRFYFSLSLHLALAIAFPFICLWPNLTEKYFTERLLFKHLFLLLVAIQFAAIFLTIVSKWVFRRSVASVINQIIRIWYRDMAHFELDSKIIREAVVFFTQRMMSTAFMTVTTGYGTMCYANTPWKVAQALYVFYISNILSVAMLQFGSGIIFCNFLFRTLNHNLARVVKGVGGLHQLQASRYVVQRRTVKLRRELTAISRIHTNLQKSLVRCKDLYQTEMLFILLTYLAAQVFMIFLVCIVFHAGLAKIPLQQFLIASFSSSLCSLDLMISFHICGRLLEAAADAGQILKDLPVDDLGCRKLEKCIEMMCLELKREKPRLRICGLVDLSGNSGFAMTQVAMLYVILLIQIDYDNF